MAGSVIACDLGTGGVKAAVFSPDGGCLAERVLTYKTHYTTPARHEQRPADWWSAFVECIRTLLADPAVDPAAIGAIALSGHSLGCIPLSATGDLLVDFVPIWSDSRAEEQAAAFFRGFDRDTWYRTTGNGFPPPLYTLFKILWLRDHDPEVFAATATIIGTKDWINYRLTGRIVTDPSYASGSGVYDLMEGDYSAVLLAAAGLSRSLFPKIVPSTAVVGSVLPELAETLGLPPGVRVVAGGVDNSCMALGARTFRDGDLFCAMGSSSWLTISSSKPVLDDRVKPYVFAHVVPSQFISATSIFAAGTTLAWVRDTLLKGAIPAVGPDDRDSHDRLMELAATSPSGANGLVFVPTLGGGTSLEGGPSVRGALVGLDLTHGCADVLRATLEGIALALRVALDELRSMTAVCDTVIMVGGGARSAIWRQIFADVFACTILKTRIDQQAASLGAAALAFVGIGEWNDFERIDVINAVEGRTEPDPAFGSLSEELLAIFRRAARHQEELAPDLAALRRTLFRRA